MADRSPLFLLLIFWTLSTGVFGAGETHVFSRSGETVHLPCRNTVQYCSTSGTTWLNSSHRQTEAVELIGLGVKKRNSDRLNLGSDCSLIISRVTTEDAGRYFCQQWRENQKQGSDSPVYLHVVAVSPSSSSSSSSSSSDVRPGLSLTLSCQLYSDSGLSCVDLFRSEHLHLSWLNEAGVNLNTDSRYQISSTGCIISLSTTLISEDEDKQWRCGVYQRNELKTSDTFTVQYSATTTTTAAAATPRHNTNLKTNKPRAASPVLSVLLSAAALAVFIAAVLCLIQRRRRAAHQRATGESAVKDENQVHYQTIHMSINPAARAHEQTEDPVTYSEVTCAGKKPEKSASDHSNDSVTYAAVSRRA
ncbi:uncharacterized protein LOC130220817 [Danio aesculapii]|uniref:uncharacterized protein LOC130220817 n=1 Tax=Danio aesculapii TaxID=1142201 RepID=UPI0024C04FFB|nr:uncharacterized protein LOC130220817 [Danio aesculapii]